MRINQTQNIQNFKGLYNNKFLLSGLEYISDHGASFATSVSFVSAVGLRPLAINMTPGVKKENKKILSADSIASGVIKFLVALGVSLPVENAIKKINVNKEQFLKKETLQNLSNKDYKFLAQTIKLMTNFISAVPKSLLAVALVPLVAEMLSFENKEEKKEPECSLIRNQSFESYRKQVSFKGGKVAKIVSSIINSNDMQEFAKKNSVNDKNIAKNIALATDGLLMLTSVFAVANSKKIDSEDKKSLNINKFLSTVISMIAGYSIDEIVQKMGSGFVEKFKKANINDKKLSKYLEGLNIARPTIIFALLYYGLIPILITFASDKLSNIKKEA